jgi:MscS family membrane protein
MVDSVLDNMSSLTQRRGDIRLEIDPSTSPEAIRQLLEGTGKILTKPAIENYNLLLSEISPRAVLITADYYTGPIDFGEFNAMKQTVNMELLDLLEKLNIEIAGTVNTVRISPGGDNVP